MHVMQNPENPYGEYILVLPEDYVEGKPYSDYLSTHTPIVMEAETN